MNSKHLLILHNGTTADGANHIENQFKQIGLTVTTMWAANNQFPADISLFNGCFLTGSPHGAYEDIDWIHQEHELIQTLANNHMPMLGVCFGSQILASALCGRDQLFRRDHCEVGFLDLPLTAAGQQDPLLSKIKDEVNMLVWHNDEVRADHADMVILASSEQCPNQIWRFRDRPIWGIQGHPELARTNAIHLFKTEQTVFEQDGADVDQLIADAHDAPEAKTLLHRFAEILLEEG